MCWVAIHDWLLAPLLLEGRAGHHNLAVFAGCAFCRLKQAQLITDCLVRAVGCRVRCYQYENFCEAITISNNLVNSVCFSLHCEYSVLTACARVDGG